MRHLDRWLSRHRIARVVNSGCNTHRPDIDVLVHGRAWTPRRVAIAVAEPTATDGTKRWRLHYAPTSRA